MYSQRFIRLILYKTYFKTLSWFKSTLDMHHNLDIHWVEYMHWQNKNSLKEEHLNRERKKTRKSTKQVFFLLLQPWTNKPLACYHSLFWSKPDIRAGHIITAGKLYMKTGNRISCCPEDPSRLIESKTDIVCVANNLGLCMLMIASYLSLLTFCPVTDFVSMLFCTGWDTVWSLVSVDRKFYGRAWNS